MTAKQIAIDGPAGAGKSTVARIIADRLSYLYIDTGAMYRALALEALRRGIAADDTNKLIELARQIDLTLEPCGDGCRVRLGNEDVSGLIRMPEVSSMASPVSAIAEVRSEMVRRQQAMASDRPVIMDGRDIGIVVLPDAGCKIFLTASSHIRAQRRTEELLAKGLQADIDDIEREIIERDRRDSSREASPLRQADDAIPVDSSDMSIEQVVEYIIKLAEGADA